MLDRLFAERRWKFAADEFASEHHYGVPAGRTLEGIKAKSSPMALHRSSPGWAR